MKVFITLSALIALSAAQFGGFGGFGGGGRPGAGVPGLGNLGNLPIVPNLANIPALGNVQNFAEFVEKTGKTYASAAEKSLREGIFAGRKETVDNHNSLFQAGKSTFELGVNIFSDLNPLEFLAGLTGRKKSAKGDELAKRHKTKSTPPASVAAIPDSFDWREKGGVTPVKFQGLECGACWSFAVTGAIEGHIFRKTGKLVSLSEQNLVDCGDNYGNTGCDGGFQDYAFEYVADNKGIDLRDKYPYIEKQDKCQYSPDNVGATIEGFATIEPGNVTHLKEVIATLGPVAASVNAEPDSFQLYKSGIYKDPVCNEAEVSHSILIVGYGSENGEDYWIIKNSWTDKWGEKGYMKLPRGQNFCGIESELSYPVV